MPETARAFSFDAGTVPNEPDAAPIALRRFGAGAPRAIVIGASTGGPQALLSLLTGLAPVLGTVPIAIVLHMPQGYTALLSSHLARMTALPVQEAASTEVMQPGHVYLGSSGTHCKMTRVGDDLILGRSDAPPVNFCKPAVDILFRSAAEACGPGVLGIVLTGMGNDGLAGAAAIVAAGGSVMAQDRETSVVWGMPGAVARAGLCAAVAPVESLAAIVGHRLRAGSTDSTR